MERQPSLFDGGDPDPLFDGGTYDPWLDATRLTGQLRKVYEALAPGEWRTLAELARFAGGSEAGVSARIRDLRKERFGAHEIEHRRVKNASAGAESVDGRGLWEYRMIRKGHGIQPQVDWTTFER